MQAGRRRAVGLNLLDVVGERDLGLADGFLIVAHGQLLLIVGLLRDVAVLEQFGVSLEVERVDRERVLRGAHRGARLIDRVAVLDDRQAGLVEGLIRLRDVAVVGRHVGVVLRDQIGRIELSQDLALPHVVALLHADLVGRLRKRRCDGDVLKRRDDARQQRGR